MSVNFSEQEFEVLEFWKKNATFQKSLKKKSPNGDYVFYDGPPFATGLPHYGHILGSVLKDVVPRYWTMQGYHVARRWGWDCHGLPIENIVEKELKMNSKKEIEKRGVAQFNDACRAQVLTYVHEWGKTVERIGRWVDFEHSYKTMDNDYIESVWWAFKEIWKKGLIYEGKKVLLNCPRCETPIAKAEVAMDNSYKEVTEDAVFVKFQIPAFAKASAGRQNSKPVYFLAWTTTPWTLPGNVALAVGEAIDYVRVQSGNEQYILAKDRTEVALPKGYTIVETMKGKKLLGMAYEPLYAIPGIADAGGATHTVLAADFVSTEEGTGIVHTAVVYGEDDYLLGEKHGLPVVPLLNEKAVFGDKVPAFLQGQYFKKADELVIQDLKKRGLAFAIEKNTHTYPHCYRCDTPLFYNAISAWFLNIQKIKPKLLKLNKKLHWHPEHFKEGRFQKSVEGAPDWNLSRNRYWASAIPIWRCEKEGCRAMEVIGSIAELREKGGSAVPADIDLHKHVVDTIIFPCAQCGGTMRRIPEVMDCWFESASMPFAQVHYPFEKKEWFEENFPAQYISEYTGQVRTWFYYMLVLSAALFDEIPFEHIVVTGTILAEDGSKMSKRLKNYPDPWKLFERYGVDALRYYLLTSPVTQAEDINFSEKGVDEAYKKVVVILQNVVRFYEIFSKDHLQPTTYNLQLHVLDRWILARLHQLVGQVTEAMDAYEVVQAVRPIGDFVSDLSTWYVRRSRDRFKNEKERPEAMATLREVLLTLSKLLAPFLPFLAEHVYHESRIMNHGSDASVHLENWPKVEKKFLDEKLLAEMDVVRKIVELGHAARESAGIKVRQPLADFRFQISDFRFDDELKQLIRDELNVKKVEAVKEMKERDGWVKKEDRGIVVALETTISDALKAEGMAREFIRGVNALRKEKSLTIHDKIAIVYGSSDAFATVVEQHRDHILSGTIAKEIEREKDVKGKEIKIGEERITVQFE